MHRDRVKIRVYITGVIILGAAAYFFAALFNLHFSDRIIVNGRGGPDLRRGFIRDRNGNYLAMTIERNSLFANPGKISDPARVAELLSPIIGVSRDIIHERLSREKQFVWLKRRLDDAAAERVRSLNIPGLRFKKEMMRVYPGGKLACNVLGFTGTEGRGLEGLEYRFDSVLAGDRVIDEAAGELTAGYDVTLTIDRFIQHRAETAIDEAAKNTGARNGMVLVMEVKTGRVLAIAGYPAFDPNFFSRYSPEQRRSYTVTDSFEPGSTLKILAMALLLELFPNLDRRYLCGGSIEVADTVIKCIDTHGSVSIDDIIRLSCNSGIIQAMKSVKKGDYHDLLRRFGFGARTGVELPGESEGILRPLKQWSGLSKYSIAIGQEISVTSLQLAAAFSAIGNRGVYMVPTIIESIARHDGSVVQSFHPRSRGRIIRQSTADRLLTMMKLAVEKGTAKRAAITYYFVIGKTGTAQKSRPTGGYYTDRETAVFVGLAPYEDPEICVLVVLDEPSGASGGAVAAPVFARVAERILPYMGIRTRYAVTRGELKSGKARGPSVSGNLIPDFRGLTMAEALSGLTAMQKNMVLTYTFRGTGRVYRQEPAPGTAAAGKVKMNLFLKEGK